MSNNLTIFENKDFGRLEILVENGKEYFPATEVAKILGYKDPNKAVNMHCKKDGWLIHPVIDRLGRTQKKKFINEGNLYRLIAKSNLPQAENFEKWVFDEVLPTIRLKGAYMTPETIEKVLYNPDFLIKLATELKELQEKNKKLEIKIEQDKPKVEFYDNVTESNTTLDLLRVSKILNFKNIGRNNLFKILREQGVFNQKNIPYQEYIDKGLFKLVEGQFVQNNEIQVYIKVVAFQKGVDFIQKLLIKLGYVKNEEENVNND